MASTKSADHSKTSFNRRTKLHLRDTPDYPTTCSYKQHTKHHTDESTSSQVNRSSIQTQHHYKFIRVLTHFAFIILMILATCHPSVASPLNSATATLQQSTVGKNLTRNNETIPLLSAKEYLAKFGWIEPTNWTAISPSLRHIFQRQRPTENLLERLTKDSSVQPSSALAELAAEIGNADLLMDAIKSSKDGDQMSDDRFKEALESFQRANGLAVTGKLDEATSMVMQQPRCGVPDKTISEGNVSTMDDESSADEYIHQVNITNDVTSSSSVPMATEASADDLEGSSGQQMLEEDVPRSERRRSVASPFQEWNLIEEQDFPFERTEFLKNELKQLRANWKGTDDELLNGGIPMYEKLMQRKNRVTESRSRQKRSDLFKLLNDWKIPGKQEITWRLSKNWPSANPYMTANEVWFTLRLAFRMWSEVLPRTFRESPSSEGSDEYVDILLGFAVGQHNECPAKFDSSPYVREYAHAWPLPWAQVHFNDHELFVPFSWQQSALNRQQKHMPSELLDNQLPISLLKVALHEIGHALGLKHSNNQSSIMYPYYRPWQDREIIELSDTDRRMVREIYGPCNTRIDAMFDMVFVMQNDKGGFYLKYNTYMFRRGLYWLYKNHPRRPQYGYPKLIGKGWRGIGLNENNFHDGVDAVMQTREQNFFGVAFFFIGEYVAEYDTTKEIMKEFDGQGNRYPRRITDVFKRGPKTVDAAMYKYEEKLIYLFKGAYVYRYRWPQLTLYDTSQISTIFPILSQSIFRRSFKLTSVDSAYYSIHDNSYYLIRGDTYWKVNTQLGRRLSTSQYISNGQRIIRYISPLGPGQPIVKKWLHVCDVGEQEINMPLLEV